MCESCGGRCRNDFVRVFENQRWIPEKTFDELLALGKSHALQCIKMEGELTAHKVREEELMAVIRDLADFVRITLPEDSRLKKHAAIIEEANKYYGETLDNWGDK